MLVSAKALRTASLDPHTLTADEHAALRQLLEQKTGRAQIPSEQTAYQADLDGDKKPETIVVATHPDLAGDFAEYKPEHHSLMVVLPHGTTASPVSAGFVHAADGDAGFEVLQLDALADLDSDGRLELLVRARHHEGFQTQVFRYRSTLEQVFSTTGGEGSCSQAN
jgi:hypothetical protein